MRKPFGILKRAKPLTGRNEVRRILMEYVDESRKFAAEQMPDRCQEALAIKLSREGINTPVVRRGGFIKSQTIALNNPESSDGGRADLDRLTRWWFGETNTKEKRYADTANRGFHFVFALSDRFSADLIDAKIDPAEIIFDSINRTLKAYSDQFLNPGDQLGWVSGYHREKDHKNAHVIVFPRSEKGDRLNFSANAPVKIGGRRGRIDYLGFMKRRFAGAINSWQMIVKTGAPTRAIELIYAAVKGLEEAENKGMNSPAETTAKSRELYFSAERPEEASYYFKAAKREEFERYQALIKEEAVDVADSVTKRLGAAKDGFNLSLRKQADLFYEQLVAIRCAHGLLETGAALRGTVPPHLQNGGGATSRWKVLPAEIRLREDIMEMAKELGRVGQTLPKIAFLKRDSIPDPRDENMKSYPNELVSAGASTTAFDRLNVEIRDGSVDISCFFPRTRGNVPLNGNHHTIF